MKQLIFIALLLVSAGGLVFSLGRIAANFRLTRPLPLRDFGKRTARVLRVGLGQSKIFRWPLIGFAHALVFWGFIVLLFGTVEMVLEGVTGAQRSFAALGAVHDLLMAAGDLFAVIVLAGALVFLFRRLFIRVPRFHGIEMQPRSHLDALLALSLIVLLMATLLGMNITYCLLHGSAADGIYPVSALIARSFPAVSPGAAGRWYEINWWLHIVLIMAFANLLPYSKHFHVFMSLPNVFLSRVEPLGRLPGMGQDEKEVRLMLDPAAAAPGSEEKPPDRFGIKDVTDATWQNYLNALSCTECGRCTAVCPANVTGKRLSPRKIFIDFRARMKEKGAGIRRHGAGFDDGRSLLRSYISEEELWACTTCNACAEECPVDINHPSLIVEMRRYLAMEEAAVPSGIKALFANIENNGAPWKFSPEDRLNWARELPFSVPLMSAKAGQDETPEYLFWVGCAGAFDERYKKVVRAFAKILHHCRVDYAILGSEESCTGDPARRAGNEMLFLLQAFNNIRLFEQYRVQKIITTCPHCYNTFLNEYPELGVRFQVVHHTQFLKTLLHQGRLILPGAGFEEKLVAYHDPCYLGRCNGEYEAAREVLAALGGRTRELRRNRSRSLCCGAGGVQLFKDAEPGSKEVYVERTDDVIASGATVVASSCPFCMTMLTDGIKRREREDTIRNYDIAELVALALSL